MAKITALVSWLAFRKKYGGRATIPDTGFCLGVRGDQRYNTCFVVPKPRARQGAQLLANALCQGVNLVQVQSRGNDRFIVDEAHPKRSR